jgi:hypothetical protein
MSSDTSFDCILYGVVPRLPLDAERDVPPLDFVELEDLCCERGVLHVRAPAQVLRGGRELDEVERVIALLRLLDDCGRMAEDPRVGSVIEEGLGGAFMESAM